MTSPDPYTRLMNAVFEFRRALARAGVDLEGLAVTLKDDEAVFRLRDFLLVESPRGSFAPGDVTTNGDCRVEICGIPFTAPEKRR